MAPNDLEANLQALTNSLVNELIALTPETMPEIRFHIAATDDGGADIGLLENHPDATKVILSDAGRTDCQFVSSLVEANRHSSPPRPIERLKDAIKSTAVAECLKSLGTHASTVRNPKQL